MIRFLVGLLLLGLSACNGCLSVVEFSRGETSTAVGGLMVAGFLFLPGILLAMFGLRAFFRK